MKLWADVYDVTETKVGAVYSIVTATVNKALDEIGSLAISTPATDTDALTLLTNEARVRVYVEHDGVSRELGRGVIRKKTATANGSGYTLNFDCVGSMDALNRKSVLLGRSYTDQPIATIAADLTALVSGWSVGVDAGAGNQTARYDGVSVFKALLRTASEKGLHVREGEDANTVEIGAFGDDSGVFIVSASHNNDQLLGNNEVVLIEIIVQETDSRDVVNWVIPMGAGEGSAAQTLKLATATSYPIGTMTAPDGSTLHYISDTTSITTYGQIEKIVTFKEIGPVANSTTAKTLAADELYDAAVAWLIRNKDPLVTYRVTVRKPRAVLRPGQLVTMSYKGYVQTDAGGGELVPISVENEQFWLMKVTERITDNGDVLDLQISSIDRYQQDMNKIVVDAIESMQARNVSVQTFPAWIINSSKDFIQTDTVIGGFSWKTADFKMKIDSLVTDVISVRLQFKTETLYATAQVSTAGVWTPIYNQRILKGTIYPNGVNLAVNGVDVTSALGGPWGSGSAIDVDVDITTYIVNAVGGIYQDHSLVFSCSVLGVAATENYPNYTASSSILASNGVVYCETRALVMTRATIPAP